MKQNGNFKEKLQEAAPTISAVMAGVSFLAGNYLTFKATPKAIEMMEAYKEKMGKTDISLIEKAKASWRCFVPSMIANGAGVGFLVYTTKKNAEKNAALTAALTVAQNAVRNIKDVYDEKQEEEKAYRKAVTDILPDKKREELHERVDRHALESSPHDANIAVADGDQLCFDALSGRYFSSTTNKIDAAINTLNKRLNTEPFNHSFMSANDFYYELGLEATEAGQYLGWYSDKGLIAAEYGSRLTKDNKPCIVVRFEDFDLVGPDELY